jgi:hypothetical protein
MKRLARIAAAAAAMTLIAFPVLANITCTFEEGVGKSNQAISNPYLTFATTSGGSMRYADIDSGWYGFRSDNGKVVEDGEYFVSGNVAAYVPGLNDWGKVSCNYGTANYFTVGYSSQWTFVVAAYNATGNLLDSISAPANVASGGSTGLRYLTISHPDISYVTFYGTGAYWCIDNLSTDAPVPEPASMTVIAMGLLGLGVWRRR